MSKETMLYVVLIALSLIGAWMIFDAYRARLQGKKVVQELYLTKKKIKNEEAMRMFYTQLGKWINGGFKKEDSIEMKHRDKTFPAFREVSPLCWIFSDWCMHMNIPYGDDLLRVMDRDVMDETGTSSPWPLTTSNLYLNVYRRNFIHKMQLRYGVPAEHIIEVKP